MKLKSFKILWYYLRDDKSKVILYIILVLLNYLPALISAFFWGKSLEYLIVKDFSNFVLYLSLLASIYIVFYTVMQIPTKKLYNYLEIKFMRNVSADLYRKINNLPAIAFEDIGVGEFINRLYTDPDRVMELLAQLEIVRASCRERV